MDLAAGMNALDDLLAEIAALGEVEGAELGRFLRKVLVADVNAEERRSLKETELVEGFGGEDGEIERGEFEGRCPELEAGDERAVGVEDGEGTYAGEVEGLRDGKVEAGENGGGFGAGQEEAMVLAGRPEDIEFDVVHDDEAVEQGGESSAVGGFEQDGCGLEKGGAVCLDAALGVEDEVVASLPGLERLDGVRDHTVEPANAVGTGNAEPAECFDGSNGGRGEGGLESVGHAYTVDDSGCRGGSVVWWRVGLVAVLAAGLAGAQQDGKKTAPPIGPPVAGDAGGDTILSAGDRAKLLASVDTVMAFASRDSGLQAVEHVKRRVLGRAEVTAYLERAFAEDESARRMQRSEIVLKKFGLLDRDFDLRPFLLGLLTEQIAGFYDDKTKYVNLLNWVPAEDQYPVLAHELTHALQDKAVDLERWGNSPLKGVSRTVAEDNARVGVDELETARQAVTEGQAMVVFVDYGLKDTGKTLRDVPEMGERMREGAGDASGSPLMARAPLVLQRTLLFPYTDGLGFEQAVLNKRGVQGAFAGVLASPPNSSYEIMTPAAYLAHAAVPVLRMPDVHAVLDREFEPYDVGVMGELDAEMLTTLFGGPRVADAVKKQWDGGVYYAGQRRTATAEQRKGAASVGLVYFSRWKTEEAARGFLQSYLGELPRKYAVLRERPAEEQGRTEQVFSTGEGDVVLSLVGREVFVSEGIGVGDARRLREGFVAAQAAEGTGPVRTASGPAMRELGLGWAGGMAGFGVMRAGMDAGRTHSSQ